MIMTLAIIVMIAEILVKGVKVLGGVGAEQTWWRENAHNQYSKQNLFHRKFSFFTAETNMAWANNI